MSKFLEGQKIIIMLVVVSVDALMVIMLVVVGVGDGGFKGGGPMTEEGVIVGVGWGRGGGESDLFFVEIYLNYFSK